LTEAVPSPFFFPSPLGLILTFEMEGKRVLPSSRPLPGNTYNTGYNTEWHAGTDHTKKGNMSDEPALAGEEDKEILVEAYKSSI